MKRIHPDYMKQVEAAYIVGNPIEVKAELNDGISYWIENILEMIGEIPKNEAPLVVATITKVADVLREGMDSFNIEMTRNIHEFINEEFGFFVNSTIVDTSSGKTSAEVMNNIHNNEVALVDKAKVHQDIHEIKLAMNLGNDGCGDEMGQLAARFRAEGRKMELESLGLWEEQT